jgi:hypothetical protein
VEEIPTHGGSLRIYAQHAGDGGKSVSPRVSALLQKEAARGMQTMAYYDHFQQKALEAKYAFVTFLIEQRRAGKKVAAYGAAAKGNTLLNYFGIKSDLLEFVADANPHKQGKWLPASHIPVVSESLLVLEKPDFVVILPWNLREEIVLQLGYIRDWGGRFVIAIPHLEIL